jgi:hypothetical protein
MQPGYCTRTYHLGDPRLIELIRTVAHATKRTESSIIAEAVEYRYGPHSPVIEHEDELPMPHLITEGDGDHA